jgi:lysozyme family protein
MAAADFAACMAFMLAQECPYPKDWSNPKNFSNNAHDPGGKTMCGVIQKEYNRYRAIHGLVPRDVRNITIHEGWNIYLGNYWQPHCPDLPKGLDLSYFDMAVNAGPGGANKVLQSSLLIRADGVWGPLTAASVVAIKDVSTAIGNFTGARARYYRALRNFAYFGRGWINRTLVIERDSRSLLTDSRSVSLVPGPFVWTAKAYEDAA